MFCTRPEPGTRMSFLLCWFSLAGFPDAGCFRHLKWTRIGVFLGNLKEKIPYLQVICSKTTQKQPTSAADQWYSIHVYAGVIPQDPHLSQWPPSLWFCAGYLRTPLVPVDFPYRHTWIIWDVGYVCENIVLTWNIKFGKKHLGKLSLRLLLLKNSKWFLNFISFVIQTNLWPLTELQLPFWLSSFSLMSLFRGSERHQSLWSKHS